MNLNMEYSCVGLNDLPDEILMIILKKLNNVEVLYSLLGFNQRLSKIVHDSIFTSRLSFVKWLSYDFIDVFSCNTILNRFVLQILPEIHDKIKWLDLESSSMQHVLCAADYPNLHTLGLYNIDEESARCLFTNETLLCGILKNQITTLIITIGREESYSEMLLSMLNICNDIFTVFTHLIHLKFYESSYKNRIRLFFDDPPLSTFRSATLLKLNIRLQCFDDCLYLLDGRFNQLQILYVDLIHIRPPHEIKNQGDLSNLKWFSLSCYIGTHYYDETILPLLYRMSNLEQLGLYLSVFVNKTFIDENHLKRNIINCMPRLSQFIFYFDSYMYTGNKLNLPLTEDIQHTFIDFPNNNIISYVDYFPEGQEGRCHIYSYPSLMEYYSFITNNFPGGLYNYVREVSLFDERPFEHEFFLRIQKSFPCLEELSVTNHKPQNRKPHFESNNHNRNLFAVKYSFLGEVNILNVHDDYIEQFLFDTKTCLQNTVILYIKYESLQRVTHNFTRDATRINCAQISKLYLYHESECSNSLEEYFPNAEICYRQIY
ncbi:unnamed protein product [Rotaria magnacalcarata]|uniref:F-box domain-containing protein n=2 Tax=Rotaria magnacalcarata TaxID=392030 RepID=A0A816X481_9BILA|nr:unnamed protein product [Rotaria magnacalcarata]